MITIIDALHTLRPGAIWAVNGEVIRWLDETQTEPTRQELDDEVARLTALQPLNDCKNFAKKLIALTDWAVLPDVGLVNQADYTTYRAALRALIINPVADPVWPTEPTPEWG